MAATVILAKCGKNGNTYGIRVEQHGNEWVSTWAFPIDEAKAKREGFDRAKITGAFHPIEDYPGCPYCGTTKLLQCGCGKMICCNEAITGGCNINPSLKGCVEGKNSTTVTNILFKCPWCGVLIQEIMSVKSFTVKSGGL
jgi:hypothetical protein